MAKKEPTYLCNSCGREFVKWQGRCPQCGDWNTIIERPAHAPAERRRALPQATALSAVSYAGLERLRTGLGEFDLVCGGGIVPGSVVLVGGEPGIGKSTLALQIAASLPSLYVSGEESPVQIRLRAERLGIAVDGIQLTTATDADEIAALAEAQRPACILVDSIQTVTVSSAPGIAGSVSQIRESAQRLVECAKSIGIPLVLIGHITKDGGIAGPKLLEHIVDTVLYFEGDFTREYRVLRAFKNRFGSVNEIGLFAMTAQGLKEVDDKNSLFTNPYAAAAPGSAVAAAVTGTRTVLFEVQSLVTASAFSNPRRMADGFDLNRLVLIVAVLEKFALLKLGSFDVFVNIAGGFSVDDTSADLAVAAAIASSLKNRPLDARMAFLAEISLSGELRPVAQCRRRVQELERSGFRAAVLSKKDAASMADLALSLELVGLETIAEALDRVF
ncbi:MAG TPA: DNA repair protein RadA [Spirochaetota bacterium]|nr:DNA repair protein RadA [Spirochaetota bacterium]HNT09280.1 DNA repair protein RadA [Spirochaetota bacterium]HNV46592.1 DNA repair protein RadA [Spirochaetota bacterium]HOS38767.1 DNA repair protein RadA [Spirochaetota bacterium]HPU87887.1 DNA repair protein RadA [Spirochaetota bacterium]